ncbi:MAG: hypothetical protein ACRENN_10350, partial [Candidatus Eiseniibacteriota bacterium]
MTWWTGVRGAKRFGGAGPVAVAAVAAATILGAWSGVAVAGGRWSPEERMPLAFAMRQPPPTR